MDKIFLAFCIRQRVIGPKPRGTNMYLPAKTILVFLEGGLQHNGLLFPKGFLIRATLALHMYRSFKYQIRGMETS